MINAPPPATAAHAIETAGLTMALVHRRGDDDPRYIQTLRQAIEEAEGAESLTLPQYRCLGAVGAGQHHDSQSAARLFQVSVPTMTGRLDSLVDRGLLQRQPDPSSRRQVLVTLTPAGQAVLQRYQTIVDARLRAILAPLSDTRQARLLAALSVWPRPSTCRSSPRWRTNRSESRYGLITDAHPAV